MKRIGCLVAALTLASTAALASTPRVKLDMSLTAKGTTVQSKILADLGEKAVVAQVAGKNGPEYSFEIRPTKTFQKDINGVDVLHLDIIVSEREAGRSVVVSRPQILLPVGQTGTVKQLSDSGERFIELTVTPTL